MTDLTPFESFDSSRFRYVWNEGENWFSVIDVIGAITESVEPRKYWQDMKRRDTVDASKEEAIGQLSAICRQFKLLAPDGKMRITDCANTEGLFRILQSVPSPKVEPFKRWLAQVGKQRLDEEANPELANERIRETYRLKGYPDEWIDKRMRGINTRNELTGEWQDRGAEKQDFSLLTSIISKGTFGVTPTDHKQTKGLKKENLRDHMNPLELLFTEVGEAAAAQLHRGRDSQGKKALERDANEAGSIADLHTNRWARLAGCADYAKGTDARERGMPCVASKRRVEPMSSVRRTTLA